MMTDRPNEGCFVTVTDRGSLCDWRMRSWSRGGAVPRTVLVNGGNRGAGLAVAQAFAAPGDRAVVPRPGGQIRALGDGRVVRARAAAVAAVPEVPAPAPVPAIEVVLVDSEDLVRRGFRQALAEAPDIAVVAEARAGHDARRL